MVRRWEAVRLRRWDGERVRKGIMKHVASSTLDHIPFKQKLPSFLSLVLRSAITATYSWIENY